MAIRPIVLYPDPVLLRATEPVETVDDDTRELVEDMVETMYEAPGIGLAANQVGVGKRVCIVDLSAGEEQGMLCVFVNPKIVATEGIEAGEEGCLSFPDVTLVVKRALKVTVEALDVEGEPFTMETEGLMARALLHECEHLDGYTFLRNVSDLKKALIKKQIKKRIKAGTWVATE
ncbi:MAG: peptide deformylase [bacterium]|nr:peptide deformylase [bacterium]